MIKRLYIDNYKCLVNFELPLDELTLLLGPNGVGKTAILDVLFALRRLLSGEARITDKDVFPPSTLTRWQSRPIQVFEMDVVLPGDEFRYRLEVEHEGVAGSQTSTTTSSTTTTTTTTPPPDWREPLGTGHPRGGTKARIGLELLESQGQPLFRFDDGEVHLYRDDYSQGPVFYADWSESSLARVPPRRDNTRLTRFLDFMHKLIICGLHPAGLEAESPSEDSLLQRDGRNFASWYRHMLQEQTDAVPSLTKALRDAIDGFQGIRLERVGQDTRALIVSFLQSRDKYDLRLDELSDGQRALLVLYSVIHLAAGQGYSLFLDEPDNYLALPEIQPWLMELSDACGADVPQAVLCSHHPELIDYLGGDRGLLLKREVSGVTVVRPAREAVVRSDVEAASDEVLKLSEIIARGWER